MNAKNGVCVHWQVWEGVGNERFDRQREGVSSKLRKCDTSNRYNDQCLSVNNSFLCTLKQVLIFYYSLDFYITILYVFI